MRFADFAGSEHRLCDVSAEIGRVLHAKGIGKPNPTPFTDWEVKKYFGGVRLICPTGSFLSGRANRCAAHTRTTTSALTRAASQIARAGWAGNLRSLRKIS